MSTIIEVHGLCESCGDVKAPNVDMMPDFMRPIPNAMPLTHLEGSLRQTMVNASAPHPHYVNIDVLGAGFWPPLEKPSASSAGKGLTMSISPQGQCHRNSEADAYGPLGSLRDNPDRQPTGSLLGHYF
jgi:hypothetical protein